MYSSVQGLGAVSMPTHVDYTAKMADALTEIEVFRDTLPSVYQYSAVGLDTLFKAATGTSPAYSQPSSIAAGASSFTGAVSGVLAGLPITEVMTTLGAPGVGAAISQSIPIAGKVIQTLSEVAEYLFSGPYSSESLRQASREARGSYVDKCTNQWIGKNKDRVRVETNFSSARPADYFRRLKNGGVPLFAAPGQRVLPWDITGMIALLCGDEARGVPGFNTEQYQSWLKFAQRTYGAQIGIRRHDRKALWTIVEGIMASTLPLGVALGGGEAMGDQGRTLAPILFARLNQLGPWGSRRWTADSAHGLWYDYVSQYPFCGQSVAESKAGFAAGGKPVEKCGNCIDVIDRSPAWVLRDFIRRWNNDTVEAEHLYPTPPSKLMASSVVKTYGRTIFVQPETETPAPKKGITQKKELLVVQTESVAEPQRRSWLDYTMMAGAALATSYMAYEGIEMLTGRKKQKAPARRK